MGRGWGGGGRGIAHNSSHSLVCRGCLPGLLEEGSCFRKKAGGFQKKDGGVHRARWPPSPAHLLPTHLVRCVNHSDVAAVLEGLAKGCAQRGQHQRGLEALRERRFTVRDWEVSPGNFRKWGGGWAGSGVGGPQAMPRGVGEVPEVGGNGWHHFLFLERIPLLKDTAMRLLWAWPWMK